MHSVPKLHICYTVLWQILRVHLCITDLELMDQNSNYETNKYSHLPLIVFGHAHACGFFPCPVFDVFASETRHYAETIESQSETGTIVLMFQK